MFWVLGFAYYLQNYVQNQNSNKKKHICCESRDKKLTKGLEFESLLLTEKSSNTWHRQEFSVGDNAKERLKNEGEK